MPLTTMATLWIHILLAIYHCSAASSGSRILRGEATIPENVACVTEEQCLEKFLTMNTGGVFYVNDFPSKGCFSKNGNGFFGTGGTDEEMAATVLTGVQVRIWCNGETASPTLTPLQHPTDQPVTGSPSQPPTGQPVTESPSQPPTGQPETYSPSSSPTKEPTPKIVTDTPTQHLTAKPTMSPSLRPSTSPSLPPSMSPSLPPSTSPSLPPSMSPSLRPSTSPSLPPSMSPSLRSSQFVPPLPSMSPSLRSSQFVPPLPIEEHSFEMTPSFASTARPSSILENNTEIVDSQLPTYTDPIVGKQLYLVGVIFGVGFLLVAIYTMRTYYGRRAIRNTTNSGDDVSVLQ
jgi:hypothetical protein